MGIGDGEMPLRGVVRGGCSRAAKGMDGESEETRVLVRVFDLDRVQRAGEGVLARRAGVVGDLDASALEGGVMEEVEIGGLVEAVVWRQVVVQVGEEGHERDLAGLLRHGGQESRIKN